jgi:hypothetical protein
MLLREGLFADSVCVYRLDTIKFFNIKVPNPHIKTMQFCSCISLLMQGFSLHLIKSDGTIISIGSSHQLTKAEFADAILIGSGPIVRSPVPGKKMVTVFINIKHNTEDACCM